MKERGIDLVSAEGFNDGVQINSHYGKALSHDDSGEFLADTRAPPYFSGDEGGLQKMQMRRITTTVFGLSACVLLFVGVLPEAHPLSLTTQWSRFKQVSPRATSHDPGNATREANDVSVDDLALDVEPDHAKS